MAYRFLISLFSTPHEAEAIEGDLLEERAAMAARDGERTATRWYRRQMIRSVMPLAMAPFREAPFLTIGLGMLFLAATWPLAWVSTQLAQMLVLRAPVYHYLPAVWFWDLVTLPPFLIVGFAIAMMMRRRAMSTSLAVVLIMSVIVCVIDPIVILTFGGRAPRQASFWFWFSRALYALATSGVLVLAGAALGIRARRKTAAS